MSAPVDTLHFYVPITRRDDEERIVEGYAFVNEVVEGEGGIRILRSAMEAATPDYMRWGAIRAMHSHIAAGTAKAPGCGVDWDEKGARLRAKIVDDQEWSKVKEGVYNGFSIGVRPRRMRNRAVEEATWLETSLVDRPMDPGAVFTVWRVDGAESLLPVEGPLPVEPADDQERGVTSEEAPTRENLEGGPPGERPGVKAMTHYDCGSDECHSHTTRGGAHECSMKRAELTPAVEDAAGTALAAGDVERVYPNEHAARLKSPDAFIADSFRSKDLTGGVRIIIGKLKSDPDGSTETQSVRFDNGKFSAEEAQKWLKDHDYEGYTFEAASVGSEKSRRMEEEAMTEALQQVTERLDTLLGQQTTLLARLDALPASPPPEAPPVKAADSLPTAELERLTGLVTTLQERLTALEKQPMPTKLPPVMYPDALPRDFAYNKGNDTGQGIEALRAEHATLIADLEKESSEQKRAEGVARLQIIRMRLALLGATS